MWPQNSEKSDEDIAKLVQTGNMDAFGILVERYERKILRYGKKFASGKEDIKDVVQNIFLKTYENIQSFDSERKFSSWLYRIAHNEFVNFLKKKEKAPLLFFDFDTFFPHKIGKKSLEKDTERKLFRKTLEKCIDKLSPKYKEPLILYYFEELDYKEIADIMRIPISTVGIRLKRGRENLKLVCPDLKNHE